MEQEEWTVSPQVRRAQGKPKEWVASSELGWSPAQWAQLTHLVVHVKPFGMVVQFLSLQGHSCHEAKSLFSEMRPRLVF